MMMAETTVHVDAPNAKTDEFFRTSISTTRLMTAKKIDAQQNAMR